MYTCSREGGKFFRAILDLDLDLMKYLNINIFVHFVQLIENRKTKKNNKLKNIYNEIKFSKQEQKIPLTDLQHFITYTTYS